MITVKITTANVTTPAMGKLKLVKNDSIMFIKERFVVSSTPSLREHPVFSAPEKKKKKTGFVMVCHAKDTQSSAV